MGTIKGDREDLEKMMENSNASLDGSMLPADEAATPELEMKPTFTMDLGKARKNCKRRARRMINNATGLMLSDHMVQENPYLRNKMQVDTLSLSGILYQLEVNEAMQETLMEEIRSGAAHPRMFEVFGNLTKTIGELNKQLLQTVEAIKTTYKDLKYDIKEKDEERRAIGMTEGVIKQPDGVISMGTKDLIKQAKLKKISGELGKGKNQDIEDAEEIK